MRWRGPAALGALWVTAAGVAVAIGLVAVQLVAGEVGSPVSTALSDGKVQQALASLTPTGPPSGAVVAPTRATSSSGPEGELRTVRTAGGAVGARCVNRSPALLYAAPADAWRTDRSTDELVRFVSASRRIEVRLSCTGEELTSVVRTRATDVTPSPPPGDTHGTETESPAPDG